MAKRHEIVASALRGIVGGVMHRSCENSDAIGCISAGVNEVANWIDRNGRVPNETELDDILGPRKRDPMFLYRERERR